MSNEPPPIEDYFFNLVKNNLQGYHTVLLIGLGRRLGIFDYLYNKANSNNSFEKTHSISFTADELSENLKLNSKYLEAWLHLALQLGFFEIDNSCDKHLKTVARIYETLIDRENVYYIGYLYGWSYKLASMQNALYRNFKSGEFFNRDDDDILEESSKDGQKLGYVRKFQTINLFLQKFKEYKRKLNKKGTILEIGCGYGYNLEIWARRFKNARIVGIDFNSKVIANVKELVKKNNWSDRITIKNISLEKFAELNKDKFDVILLNEILHELDPDESYRRQIIEIIYKLLNDDGILIVGESMMPDMYDHKNNSRYWEIIKKWDEVGFNATFYNEKTFKDFILSTSFKKAKFVRGEIPSGKTMNEIYFWAVFK